MNTNYVSCNVTKSFSFIIIYIHWSQLNKFFTYLEMAVLF